MDTIGSNTSDTLEALECSLQILIPAEIFVVGRGSGK